MTDVDDWRDYGRDDYEPDPTDWLEAEAQREHEEDAHHGGPCDCPPGEPATEPPGGYCDEPPF